VSAETQLELSIVEQYVTEREQRQADLLHWVAEELDKDIEEEKHGA
jgi:hypothetical protein